MVSPLPSQIFEYRSGKVWVGGVWDGMRQWMSNNDIAVQVNCLYDGRFNCPSVNVLHVDLDTRRGLGSRLQTCLASAASALAEGKSILIHCRRGIHRSGAFVVLLMGLFGMLGDGVFQTFEDAVMDSQANFADRRGLPERKSRENRQAVTEYMEYIQDPGALVSTFRSILSAVFRPKAKHRPAALESARFKSCTESKAAMPRSKTRPQSLQSVQSLQLVPKVVPFL